MLLDHGTPAVGLLPVQDNADGSCPFAHASPGVLLEDELIEMLDQAIDMGKLVGWRRWREKPDREHPEGREGYSDPKGQA